METNFIVSNFHGDKSTFHAGSEFTSTEVDGILHNRSTVQQTCSGILPSNPIPPGLIPPEPDPIYLIPPLVPPAKWCITEISSSQQVQQDAHRLPYSHIYINRCMYWKRLPTSKLPWEEHTFRTVQNHSQITCTEKILSLEGSKTLPPQPFRGGSLPSIEALLQQKTSIEVVTNVIPLEVNLLPSS